MSACSFGMCAVATCEKCKPKLLTCPTCGKRTYIADICVFCRSEISKQCQTAAIETWKRKHLEEMKEERRSGKSHQHHIEKEMNYE